MCCAAGEDAVDRRKRRNMRYESSDQNIGYGDIKKLYGWGGGHGDEDPSRIPPKKRGQDKYKGNVWD